MPSLDIKWRNRISLKSLRDRSYRHLTPTYVISRLRHAVHRKAHPADPDLTEPSIDLLRHMLRLSDIGAEWGSGNSTAWLARNSAHITSFENNADYVPIVQANLAAQGIINADLRYIAFRYLDDERDMHAHAWVKSAEEFDDDSLDYALVDSAPRGCICRRLVNKIKRGGLLILDNANWYIPPPIDLKPFPASSVKIGLGYPDGTKPDNICWPFFTEATKHWRWIWTSNGVTATLIMIKT